MTNKENVDFSSCNFLDDLDNEGSLVGHCKLPVQDVRY